MTEWKSKVPYSSSSQSSIAALKDVLAYGRLTSSPPLPLHPLAHYRPPLYPIPIPIGAVCGLARGCGGGGGKGSRARQSATLCRSAVRGGRQYSPGASSALTKIVPYSSSVYTAFHSVIYNSVDPTNRQVEGVYCTYCT